MPAAHDGALHVASFYRFFPLADPAAERRDLERAAAARGLVGTLLLATEGVNGALAGARGALLDFLAERFPDARPNWSTAAPGRAPFRRLKVAVKEEIVGFGRVLEEDAPRGERVDAARWNRLAEDPEVRVVDVRNDYETAIGTFAGAMPAGTRAFRDFAAFAARELDPGRDRRVALFCTGGIRCEKASAHLRERGFEQVHQLAGGILRYFAETSPANSLFSGECFVFDGRVSVTAALDAGTHRLCAKCAWPLPTRSNAPCPACGRA